MGASVTIATESWEDEERPSGNLTGFLTRGLLAKGQALAFHTTAAVPKHKLCLQLPCT